MPKADPGKEEFNRRERKDHRNLAEEIMKQIPLLIMVVVAVQSQAQPSSVEIPYESHGVHSITNSPERKSFIPADAHAKEQSTPKTEIQSASPAVIQGITMTAKISTVDYKPEDRIEITLTFKNEGTNPVTFQREGAVWAVFLINGMEKTFLQAVPRSHARRGVWKDLIQPLEPGATWSTKFEIIPKKNELGPGRYPIIVKYTVDDHYTDPEEGQANGALVGTFVSDPVFVSIKAK